MIDAVVAVENLTKVFPIPFHRHSIVAVRDLNLRVESAEVYGLLERGPAKARRSKSFSALSRPLGTNSVLRKR
jgi:ABC-type glutathione transport system ATPase component